MTTTGNLRPSSHSNQSEFQLGHDQIPPLPTAASPPPGDRQPPTSHPGSMSSPIITKTGPGGSRTVSKGGGAQVTLDETGSWSDLANRDEGRQVDADGRSAGGLSSSGSGSGRSKPKGMLGFLSRQKGRERSPKPQEAGVLGKEGARVVVGGR